MRLTKEELSEMFGETIPNAAIDLIFVEDHGMSLDELRSRLRVMGDRHKCMTLARRAALTVMSIIAEKSPDMRMDDQADLIADAAVQAFEAGRNALQQAEK